MRIKSIELYHASVPLKKEFYPAWIQGYAQTTNNFNLINVTTDEGIEGVCAGMAFGDLGEYKNLFLAEIDPTVEAINQRLKELGYSKIEAAFWDILGKMEGKPVYELLGGKGGKIAAYCSTGELHSPEQRAKEVIKMKEMGFKAIKLRIHSHSIKEDVKLVEMVRNAVGDGVELMVDANQGWIVDEKSPRWDLQRAIETADALAEYNVKWLEEPLDMHAHDELSELRKHVKIPIAGGELVSDWHEFKVIFEKGCYDIYQPDASLTGITMSKKVLDVCVREGLKFSPHTWTNGIGFLINLHILAANPNREYIEYPYEPPSWVPEVRDAILKEPIEIDENGHVQIPEGPGFGIELDMEALKKYGQKL